MHHWTVLRQSYLDPSVAWSAKLSTFAWRLVAGVLPVGKATGRKMAPEFDALDEMPHPMGYISVDN